MYVTCTGSTTDALRDFIRLVNILDLSQIMDVCRTDSSWSIGVHLPIQELGQIQAWITDKDSQLRVADFDASANSVRFASGLPIRRDREVDVWAQFLMVFMDYKAVAAVNSRFDRATYPHA